MMNFKILFIGLFITSVLFFSGCTNITGNASCSIPNDFDGSGVLDCGDVVCALDYALGKNPNCACPPSETITMGTAQALMREITSDNGNCAGGTCDFETGECSNKTESNCSLLGDVTGDGELGCDDAKYIFNIGLNKPVPNNINESCADLTGDGVISSSDAQASLTLATSNQGNCNGTCNITTGECEEELTCTDTDGGLNYSQQGTVTLGNQTRTDYCINNTRLKEYQCITTQENTHIYQVIHQCEDNETCQNGACVETGLEEDECDSCESCTQKINNAQPGTTIKLVNDITFGQENTTNYTCIKIDNKNHVTFDGQNHTIKPLPRVIGGFVAIKLNHTSNIKIKNIKTIQTKQGITLNYSNNNILENVTINNNSYVGIHLLTSEHNLITDVNINNIFPNGIYLDKRSNNNTIQNVIVTNTHSAISLFGSSNNNTIQHIIINNNNSLFGIRVYHSNENKITDANIKKTTESIVIEEQSEKNTIQNIRTDGKIKLKFTKDNIIKNAKLIPSIHAINSIPRIVIDRSYNNTIENTIINNNPYSNIPCPGILIFDSELTTIKNSVIKNTKEGIHVKLEGKGIKIINTKICDSIEKDVIIDNGLTVNANNNTCDTTTNFSCENPCENNNSCDLKGDVTGDDIINCTDGYCVWLKTTNQDLPTECNEQLIETCGDMDNSGDLTAQDSQIIYNLAEQTTCNGTCVENNCENRGGNLNNDECDSCESCTQKINNAQPGSTIKLVNDITYSLNDLTQQACVYVNNKSNVLFDCQNHKIKPVSTPKYAIISKNSNQIFVKNCKTENNLLGLKMIQGSENNIQNFESNNDSIGVMFEHGNNNYLTNSVLTNNATGVNLLLSNQNNVSNVIINSPNIWGLKIQGNENNILDSEVNNAWQAGVYIGGNAVNNIIDNVSATGGIRGAFVLSGNEFSPENQNIIKNSSAMYSYKGFEIGGSNYLIENNTVNGNTYGVYVSSFARNNNLKNNTACNNSIDIELDSHQFNNTGSNNTCIIFPDYGDTWSDEGVTGCTNSCQT